MAKTFTPKLSPRLEGIVSLVPKCGTVADIGCDHGYTCISLLQRDKASKAIACDIKEGPLEFARKNTGKAGLNEKTDIRLAPGLEGLKKGEADVIVIAGMGARTIADILTDSMEIAKEADYLILQPQSEIPEMRTFLRDNGFNILQNKLMIEEDKYYFAMLVSAKNEGDTESDYIAPRLRRMRNNPELMKFSKTLDDTFGLDLIFEDKNMAYYLTHVLNEWRAAVKNLSGAKKPDYEKMTALQKKIELADLALELNTLLCGIDERIRSFLDNEYMKRAEEE